MNPSNLRIDPERLWSSLMEMAQIGATPKGGCSRLALTDLDRQARDLFVTWCRKAGCAVTVDRMGNIFARRPGRRADLAPVATGSHLDTQPTGGKFDGVYGVLAGLEVIRTLNDHQVETEAPVELAMWTNEEGTRFAPAMVSSGVFAGVFTEEYGHSRTDADGVMLGAELARIGYLGSEPAGAHKFGAFIEAHIEQGPILEAEGKTIGVVLGIQGVRWYDVEIGGTDAHAGTTPMALRKDATLGSARIIDRVHDIAIRSGGVGTVGAITVKPNSRNTIAGEVFFSVDLRHPDETVLTRMNMELQRAIVDICVELGLRHDCKEIWHSPAVRYDPSVIAAVRQAAADGNVPHMDIISGAGHDAGYISRVAPTGMIFVPCAGGLSHNEMESATKEDLAAGGNVLLHALIFCAANVPGTTDGSKE